MAAADAVTPAEVSEEALLRRILAGDESAFETLYRRYLPRVYHFLGRRLGNRADVEETTQEVFFNVFAALDTYRGKAPFGAWVFGITRRTLANRFKKRRIEAIALEVDQLEFPRTIQPPTQTSPDPFEVYELHERLTHMARAVQELTPEQRTLFELHHLQCRPIEEVARVTDKTQDAVKSLLYRTRKILMAQ